MLYKRNIYTVPEGTYKGRGTEVFITVTDNELTIKDIYGNHLCTHTLGFGKGRIIHCLYIKFKENLFFQPVYEFGQ